VASHGYNHKLCTECSTKDLEKDLIGSKKLLEDIIGAKVYGYRSPSFSINKEVLRLIEDSGYLYDSSYNSFGLHGRYGKLDISGNEKKGIAIQFPKEVSGEAAFHKIVKRFYFYELPISNLSFTTHKSKYNLQSSIFNLQSLILPWGGGGYFRLIPFAFFKRGIRSILEKEKAYLFYMHPWEIDPEQPKVKKAPFFFRLRHYVNLDRSLSKLNALVESFKSASFVSCREYLASIGNE
jgi:polysaccharide deacetylase family protein (PEP-CTERM system associated)